MNSAMQAQMPKMIIEASKVAREQLAQERDDSASALKATIKKLEQSQAEMSLKTDANSLKTEGLLSSQSDHFIKLYYASKLLLIDSPTNSLIRIIGI